MHPFKLSEADVAQLCVSELGKHHHDERFALVLKSPQVSYVVRRVLAGFRVKQGQTYNNIRWKGRRTKSWAVFMKHVLHELDMYAHYEEVLYE
jgi:hypothetical protein